MPEDEARPEEPPQEKDQKTEARPTIVLFVRHGTTPTTGKVLPGQAPGLHLAEEGRREAQRVAERIAALGPDVVSAVYASSLERARETAAPIAKLLGRRTRIDGQLVDIDYGDWTGYEIAEVHKLPEWRAVMRWPSGFRFPGGESFVELQARVGTVVERLRRAHPGQVVVAVSHSDPIRIATAAVLGVSLDMFHRLVVAPCSVTAHVYEQAGASVLTLNSTGDLGSLGDRARQEMSDSYELDSPDRLAVGTLGPVGEREFFLQVREGTTLVTLKVEKQHIAALAQYLGRILRELPRPAEVPSDESLELEDFVEPAFVVAALAVSYDEEADRVLLVAEEIPAAEQDIEAPGEEDEPNRPLGSWPQAPGGGRGVRAGGTGDVGDADLSDDPGGSARISITRAQAAAFAVRGARLVAAGRPPCPLCGYPLDPRGHVCPRTNGHRPPRT